MSDHVRGRSVEELEALLAERERELAAARERERATADILPTVTRANDRHSVLDAIVDTAARLLAVEHLTISEGVGDGIATIAASSGRLREQVVEARAQGRPFVRLPFTTRTTSGRAILTRSSVRVDDLAAARLTEFTDIPAIPADAVLSTRSFVVVPLLRDGEPIAALRAVRFEVRPFDDAEVDLLETFADQAAIAIANARLFQDLNERTTEVREALDQQTATSQVLQLVSRAALDLQTVLDTLIENAVTLTGADTGMVFRVQLDRLLLWVNHGVSAAAIDRLAAHPIRFDRATVAGRAALGRGPVRIDERWPRSITDARTYRVPMATAVFSGRIARRHHRVEGGFREMLVQSGLHSLLSVPMMQQSGVVGALVLARREPGEYPADVLDLLQTFASQSAVAIQNARLFAEIEEKSRQLEEASRHKSEFLATMSRELRTPLNAIIGFTDVLLERYFGEVNEKQEDYLKDVPSSGQHLLALINDILDLSKVEAGRMNWSWARSTSGMRGSGTGDDQGAGDTKGITLKLEVAEDVGRIEADERKVKHVVFNLLTNAVKFTPDNGKVPVSAVRAEQGVEIAVRDTGVGIAQGDLGKIFEEFGQARNQAGQTEGTGLGLALVQRYAELHGGAVRVESVVGQGSTFTIALPERHEAAP
ncbi:MAG: GAF domain-containing protein [Chloroflexota bacterium]|nr:MAG: GAF domain-containing protein [Chloroflexota bacterium]